MKPSGGSHDSRRLRLRHRPGQGKLEIQGDLTIRCTSRSVTFSAEELGRGKDPWGNQRVGFSARAQSERSEFGLKWNQVLEAGGVLVGEKVDLELDVELIQKA